MSSPASNRIKVLIADLKSPHEADLLMRLERLGYYLTGAPVSAEHASRLSGNQLPDLVLLGQRGAGLRTHVDLAGELQGALNRPVVLLSDDSEPDEIPVHPGTSEAFPLLVLPCTDRELCFNLQTAVSRHLGGQTLIRQRDWLHSNLQFLADAVVVTDEVGRLLSLNLAAEHLTGWSHTEAFGQLASTVLTLLDPVTRLPLNPIEDALGLMPPTRGKQFILVSRKGRERNIEDSTAVIPGEGSPAGCVFVFRDITEKLQTERQLQQIVRMESLGRLTAGIANDFNNLLTVIVGAGAGGIEELSSGSATAKEAAQDHFSHILTAADTGAQLARKLLSLGGAQISGRTHFAINDLLLELEPAMRAALCDEVELEILVAAERSIIWADRQQVEQVILNLLLNARDAISGAGKISITTEPGDSPSEIRLTVTDTGIGIPPEVQSRVFEPFFTTKQRTLGTGLGLTGIYAIVTQSRGRISLASSVGAGSSFMVTFPLVEDMSDDVTIPAADFLATTESVVLLVEDDAAVRQLQTTVLTSGGFKVQAVANGEDALRLFQMAPDHVGVVVTDVVMPGMSGLDLARQIRTIRPNVPLLFVSGFSDEFMKIEGFPAGKAVFLKKPFHPQSFKAAVLGLLETGKP